MGEPLRRTLNKDMKEKNEAGEERGKDEKDEDEGVKVKILPSGKDERSKAKKSLGQGRALKTKKDEEVEAKISTGKDEGVKPKKDEEVKAKISSDKDEGVKTKKEQWDACEKENGEKQ